MLSVAIALATADAHAQRLIVEGASGSPGGRVEVVLSLADAPADTATVNLDILFDEAVLSIDDPDLSCWRDGRVTEHSMIATRPSVPVDPEGVGRLRLALIDASLPFPVDTLSDGVLITCSFKIRPEAAAGESALDFDPEYLQIGSDHAEEICAEDCDVATGAVTVVDVEAVLLPPCTGDCDSDGVIAVSELVLGTRILLGRAELSRCAGLAAAQSVVVSDLVRAVGNALSGCPVTIAPDFSLSMSWSGCPGAPFYCPQYRASVDASGVVEFEGLEWVEHLGRATFQIDPKDLEPLARELHQAAWFSRPCCECNPEGPYIADAPAASITARSAGVETGANLYFGCDTPDRGRMADLISAIEDALGLCPWIGSMGFGARCR